MKLVIAIIQDQFVSKVTRSLMQNRIKVTKISSSGGFLKSGSTTLLIGTEEEHLDDLIEIIKANCRLTKVSSGGEEFSLGGANVFVINTVDHIRA